MDIAKRERQVAWGGLIAGGALCLLFVVAYLSRWAADWQPWAAFWSLGGGFTVFYGAACFAIWDVKRRPDGLWLSHQYWLNGLGCLVGWGALYLLWRRHSALRPPPVDWSDLGLGAVAFLGLVGHLPVVAVGLGVALRNLARKALEAASTG